MFKKRSSERFVWGLFALLVSAAAIAGDEPREWLERMNEALTTRNYDGVFQHWQDGKVEQLRIIHRVKNGEVRERLVSLDGSGREFIRTGSELACYLPDKRTVLIEKRSDTNPMLGNLPKFDEASTAFYDISEDRRTRLNRRDTRVISVKPKDAYRYGYKLWIDEETAMPVRTQLCDQRGRVIEQLVLAADLRVNTNIPDSAFNPEVSTEGFRFIQGSPRVVQQTQPGNVGSTWEAQGPPGFRMMLRGAQVMPGSDDTVAHLVLSDGVSTVSVFVQSYTSAQPDDGAPAATGQVGSTSAFSRWIDKHTKATAVGEVPPQTVESIANSVKPTSASAPNTSAPTQGLSLKGPPRGR
jgi:sigma-E factor negative regulatory protein RseB